MPSAYPSVEDTGKNGPINIINTGKNATEKTIDIPPPSCPGDNPHLLHTAHQLFTGTNLQSAYSDQVTGIQGKV
jgi:hypothetical protein